ncbi:elongation factor G, partial [Nitrospirota bacterium]
DKGVQEAMKAGIYAGYKMEDVKVTLYDGSYHAVDSSEMAFKLAGSMAIKKAVEDAKPIVLEPIMNVDIATPDEYLGTVIGDINSRRGKVLGMDQDTGSTNQKIEAMIPMVEMLTYANQLQSMTAGRGVFSMELATYEELPKHLTQKLVDEKQQGEEEA